MAPVTQADNLKTVFPKNILLNQSILDVFVLQNVIDLQDAERLKSHLRTNQEVENFLLKNRLVTRDIINKAYSILLKLPYVELKNVRIPEEAMQVVPEKLANKYKIIAFGMDENVIKIAMSRPSELLLNYTYGLGQLLEKKGLVFELFVTGDSDFNEAVKQYKENAGNRLLLDRGSLPVVFLRNRQIGEEFLNKIPREFVEKYRILIFDQNVSGHYLAACESPDSPVTQKIIKYLETENNIKLEVYATSKEDIDSVLGSPQIEQEGELTAKDYESISQTDQNLPEDQKPEDLNENVPAQTESEKTISEFLRGFFQPKNELTVDSTESNNEKTETLEAKLESVAPLISKQSDVVTMPANPVSAAEPSANQDVEQFTENTVIHNKTENAPAQEEIQNTPERQNDNNNGPESDEPSLLSRTIIESKQPAYDNNDIGSLLSDDISTVSQMASIINEGYVPKIVAGIINFAQNNKSSDIHIEPQVKSLRFRCRIDGILVDVAKAPIELHPKVISRVKILAKLKIDESRIPQDGRFDVTFKNKEVDVRVSTLPTVHGEKVVMRVLDKNQRTLSLEDLGMQGSAFDKTVNAIAKPWGIILSTGPTGSGKSTTLNAIINRLNVPGKNIITLEDPVEYETPGVNQCQVKPEIGFTFASGLRSVLRQDPNIIMVGEVRDAETAGMVTHAALTGHLVLSTLHTNDTSGALPRLINMGIEPFLITSSIDLIIAQRLVRVICNKCKEEIKLPVKVVDEIKREIDLIPKNSKDAARIPNDLRFYYGKGCPECSQGYKGRLGIFETLVISPKIEELAVAKRPANEIKEAAIREGMITMKQDGILKALQGMTTIDEIYQAAINS